MYSGEGPGGVSMLPCDESGADSTYCLDDCSGYSGEIDADDFKYRYYMPGPRGSRVCSITVNNSDTGTCDSAVDDPCCVDVVPDSSYWPYTIGCYVGCLADDIASGACSSSEDGYTGDYTAEVKDSGLTIFTGASSPTTDCSSVDPTPFPSTFPTHVPTDNTSQPVGSSSSNDDDGIIPMVDSNSFSGASVWLLVLIVALGLTLILTCAYRRRGEGPAAGPKKQHHTAFFPSSSGRSTSSAFPHWLDRGSQPSTSQDHTTRGLEMKKNQELL